MQLVESYLYEVGRFLPKEERDELLADLRDDILGEIEGAAEAAGRAPQVADEQEVIARFGHPLKAAGRYQKPRALIGTDLYPAFMHTLKVVSSVAVFGLYLVWLIGGEAADWRLGPFALLGMFIEVLLWVFASVVLVFVAIEYSGERLRWYENWQPSALSSTSLGVINRQDVITNLISEGFFLLWWNNVVVLVGFLPEGAAEQVIALSPIWATFFWPLNIIFGVLFVLHFYVLVRGIWQRYVLLAEVVGNTALLAIVGVLLSSGDLVLLNDQFPNGFASNAQLVVKVALSVVCAAILWDIWLAFKAFRGAAARLRARI
ncbi:MAG: hypothetical protein V2I41_02800 [Pseudomonadales bacterium]|jgi:hypothetical protein|nr:hypothetical protein [Pseudomonadales bacterium]